MISVAGELFFYKAIKILFSRNRSLRLHLVIFF